MEFDIENEREKFLRKSVELERDSSMGCSSRISYYRSGEGVPFKWEMQPGIAKESVKEELLLLPLTPPPGLHSLELPKPCINNLPHPKSSPQSWHKFWNKKTKHGKGKKHQENSNEGLFEFGMFSRLDCSCDFESMCDSSFSWSSSVSTMKGRRSLQSSTSSESPISEVHRRRSFSFGCISMHIPRTLLSIAKRD